MPMMVFYVSKSLQYACIWKQQREIDGNSEFDNNGGYGGWSVYMRRSDYSRNASYHCTTNSTQSIQIPWTCVPKHYYLAPSNRIAHCPLDAQIIVCDIDELTVL